MRNLKTAFLLSFISLTLSAQKIIEKNIDFKNQTIDLNVKFASEIEVRTWDNPTVYFKADIVTEDGKYLDLYELNVKESDTKISIVSNTQPMLKEIWEEYQRNRQGNKKWYYSSEDRYKFNYTLYVPKNATLKVSSINGNLKSELIEGEFTADLINGDIEIVKYAGNLDLSTINGEIDLKMMNVNLVAETIHGDIYADEKLNFSSTNRHVGQKITGRFNNATYRLRLNTINGNMYLRL